MKENHRTTGVQQQEGVQNKGALKKKHHKILIARLHKYLLLNRNFARVELNRDELVVALSTNRTSLSEAVKSVTGKTLMGYIRVIQLREARQMLEECPELTIETIAGSCGFRSRHTFYRLFCEQYHVNPSEYRNNFPEPQIACFQIDTPFFFPGKSRSPALYNIYMVPVGGIKYQLLLHWQTQCCFCATPLALLCQPIGTVVPTRLHSCASSLAQNRNSIPPTGI